MKEKKEVVKHSAAVQIGFPVVIGKFLALRNYALQYK
jgi:hypothetical protein